MSQTKEVVLCVVVSGMASCKWPAEVHTVTGCHRNAYSTKLKNSKYYTSITCVSYGRVNIVIPYCYKTIFMLI